MPVEIVPGITAAFGAAATAGFPLTHRAASSIVSFVAGQCQSLSSQNWAGLAGVGRTLVIYMGLATAGEIAEKLIADGLAPSMPLAIVERATLPGMRVVRGCLAELAELVAQHRITSPALIVIGEVTQTDNDAVAAAALDAAATLRSEP